MPADFTEIAELVDWAATHNDPDEALRELSRFERASRPDVYAELDAQFVDVDDEVAPEEGDV